MGPNERLLYERLLYVAMTLAKEQITSGKMFYPSAKPHVLNMGIGRGGLHMPVLKFVRNTEIVAWTLTKK